MLSNPSQTKPLHLVFLGSLGGAFRDAAHFTKRVFGARNDCEIVNSRVAHGVLVCKHYNDGCGFAIPIRSLNGAQQTGGTVSYNQLQVGGQKFPHTWRLNLTHHCGCVNEPATVVSNPFGTDKIVMRRFTPVQAREFEELAGTSQTNDVIYAIMSGKSQDITWDRDWFGVQLRAARRRHEYNTPSISVRLNAARDKVRTEGGTLDLEFDSLNRVKSLFVQTPRMKAAAQAYGSVGQFFEVDGSMLDQFNSEWVLIMSVVICALGKSLVTSAVVALGGETMHHARTVVEKAGHKGAFFASDGGVAFRNLLVENLVAGQTLCTWHEIELAQPNLSPSTLIEPNMREVAELPLQEDFRAEVANLIYTHHHWRPGAEPLVLRDFRNLKLRFPQACAQKYIDALFSVRFKVLVYYVTHFVNGCKATQVPH